MLMDPSHTHHQEQSFNQLERASIYSSQSHAMGTQLGPPKQEPYVQPYAHFPKGNTIGDPVSVEEKGRQWQNYKPDKYFLPNDAIEQDRLDSAHRMMCLALHNILDPSNRPHNPEDVLSLAPIHGDPARVLDIATGTGI